MDKFKEKLNALRVEADGANARAESSEQALKKVQDTLAQKENEVNSLNNKIALLQLDYERAEKRIDQVKVQNAAEAESKAQADALQRKIALLEKDLVTTESSLKVASEKVRTLELQSEQWERKANNLELEKTEIETKLDTTVALYQKTKRELEDTLKQLEEL